MAKKNMKGKVRNFIIYYTQFEDTKLIHEKDLQYAVNKELGLTYEPGKLRTRHLKKMKEFEMFKGDDNYMMYKRTDIDPSFPLTRELLDEIEEAYEENKWYNKNEEFLYTLEFAKKNDLKDFENYLLKQKLFEEMVKKE